MVIVIGRSHDVCYVEFRFSMLRPLNSLVQIDYFIYSVVQHFGCDSSRVL